MNICNYESISFSNLTWGQFSEAESLTGGSVYNHILLCQAIGEIVVKSFNIPDCGFWGGSRGAASVAYGRQISMYLAHVVCGLNFTQIGLAFERDRTTVSHACCLVEDRRDDPVVDDLLDDVEHSILCLLDTGFYLNRTDIEQITQA